jgi:hypothetical protein
MEYARIACANSIPNTTPKRADSQAHGFARVEPQSTVAAKRGFRPLMLFGTPINFGDGCEPHFTAGSQFPDTAP